MQKDREVRFFVHVGLVLSGRVWSGMVCINKSVYLYTYIHTYIHTEIHAHIRP